MALTGWPADVDDDGSGQTGTLHNQAFSDAEEAAIEAYIVSATNPTITPKAIIDEVVTARGTKASLDARLDVALNEDGTLKPVAGAVTETTIKTLVGARNVVDNGDFEDWTAGVNVAPNLWTATGAGVAIQRTGPGDLDTFTFGTTQYTARVTRSGADCQLEQDIIPAASFANFVNVKGQKFSVAVKVKAGLASQARIQIDDGITQTNSSFHTGGGTEEHLTAVHTISGSATRLTVELQVITSDGAVYFGGAQGVFSDLAPSDWQPKSNMPSASATRRGILDLAFQQIRGAKEFQQRPTFLSGGAGATAGASGLANSQFTQVGNVGAGEDDLIVYTLPANSLSSDGTAIRITAAGSFAANANAKRIRAYFAVTSYFVPESLAFNDLKWRFQAELVRNSSTTLLFSARLQIGDVTIMTATEQYVHTGQMAGQSFGVTNVIKLTGEATADNDIIQTYQLVETLGQS